MQELGEVRVRSVGVAAIGQLLLLAQAQRMPYRPILLIHVA